MEMGRAHIKLQKGAQEVRAWAIQLDSRITWKKAQKLKFMDAKLMFVIIEEMNQWGIVAEFWKGTVFKFQS